MTNGRKLNPRNTLTLPLSKRMASQNQRHSYQFMRDIFMETLMTSTSHDREGTTSGHSLHHKLPLGEFLHWNCKRHISQHIKILAFTKDNINSCLKSTIPNDPSLLADLKKYMSCYPHIDSMMYIPLNSAIVVEVYRNSRKDETLYSVTRQLLSPMLVRSVASPRNGFRISDMHQNTVHYVCFMVNQSLNTSVLLHLAGFLRVQSSKNWRWCRDLLPSWPLACGRQAARIPPNL